MCAQLTLILCVLFFFFLRFISLFLAVLGLQFIVVHGLLIAVASLFAEHRLWNDGSVVVAHGLSCPAARGIFLEQGSNPCPFHRQVNSITGPPGKSPMPPFFFLQQHSYCNLLLRKLNEGSIPDLVQNSSYLQIVW